MDSRDGHGKGPRICRAPHFTQRQREILVLLVGRMTTKEAAKALTLSLNTVKSHVGTMMAVAGVHDRRDLVRLAIAQHLVDITVFPPRWAGCGCPLERESVAVVSPSDYKG